MGSATVAGRPPLQSFRPLRQTVVTVRAITTTALVITHDPAITDAVLMIIVISTVLLALAVDLGAAFEWLHNRRR